MIMLWTPGDFSQGFPENRSPESLIITAIAAWGTEAINRVAFADISNECR
jgi:hypothetical protein